MRPFLLFPLLAGGLLLASCATISEEACLQGDWAGIGFKDGEAGHPQSRLDEHAKACAKTGVAPDPAPYFAARAQGLRLYCTPDRGFREGRLGHSYAGVCPEPAAGRFLPAYADGQLVHAAAARLSQARSDRVIAASDRPMVSHKPRYRLTPWPPLPGSSGRVLPQQRHSAQTASSASQAPP